VGRGVSATYVAAVAVPVALAVALATLLAGCGGGDRSKPSTRTTEPASSNASSRASPASGAGTATTPATTATSATPSADAYWPYAKVVASLAGRTVTVANAAAVRLDPALVECNGEGAARQTGATRSWSRYTCTQTVFQGGVDHDVTFDVVISSATQLSIKSPRTGPE
jgi:hypothetical protein